LNAPAGTAFHFLEMVKTDEMLKTIPIIALANSRDEHDVSTGYELGLAGYIVKSEDWAGLCKEMAAVWDYWAMSLVPPTS
jgi:two-component system response regulator